MKPNVLIVDDSLTVRMDLEEAFASANFAPSSCATLAAARAALAQAPFALVVLDVVLPDGDGISFLRELRSSEGGTTMPVMLLSTEAEVRDRILGLQTGADEYVGKPYDTAYVTDRARELVALRSRSVGSGSLLVLVIDDSVTFREGLRESLESVGYQVVTAASGEEGLRRAISLRPGAVIVDNVMTGIDGATVIRRMRQDSVLRRTPCVLLTASEDRRNEVLALEAGADAYVRKEDDIQVILARLAAVVRSATVPSGEASSSFLGPKKIMVVDDSPTFLQALASHLHDENYDVVLVPSGGEALELLAVQAVDCILLDLEMPGMSGEETCRRIKSTPRWRDIPLLILSGSERDDAMVEAINAGADDFVVKSGEFDILKARLRAQLRRKQFEDEKRHIREEALQRELRAAEARASEELAETRAQLLDELQQKNLELSRARDELEEKNLRIQEADRVKTEFFTNISHELRTPLNAIIGFSELLTERAELDDQQARYVRHISEGGHHLLDLINDLLDQSKLEAGRIEIKLVGCAAGTLVRETAETLDPLARNKQVELSVVGAGEGTIPLLQADAFRLKQVLYNLVANAIKFTPAGGRVEVRTHLAADGKRVCTTVSDNGPGIAAEDIGLLFTPFVQLKPGAAKRGGTGLGLSLSKKLVELMGGTISVTSQVGRGSAFTVALPLFAAEATAAEKAAAPAPLPESWLSDPVPPPAPLPEAATAAPDASAERPLVLVVDDREDVRRYIYDVLAQQYRVEQATNGKEGLTCAVALRPDLILSDLMMPEMNGSDMVRAIRQRHELDSIPIVMLTANTEDDLRIQLLREGAQDYLLKPFSAAELRARAGNLVAMKRARDLLQGELSSQQSSLEALAAEVVARRRDAEKALEWMRVARDQAESASALKTRFVAMVSHELRTPLTSLLLAGQHLERHAESLTGRQADTVHTMTRASERLRKLIEELLDYARVQGGLLQTRPEDFDLNALTSAVIRDHEAQAAEKGLTLRLVGPGRALSIHSDQTLLGIVLANLVGNAIKFTPRGSVEVTLAEAGAGFTIAVRDSGPGIPDDAQLRIFEPFEHLEPVSRKHTPGMGLGLALVRDITQALGGRVDLRSEAGAGSTFTLVIPRVATQTAEGLAALKRGVERR